MVESHVADLQVSGGDPRSLKLRGAKARGDWSWGSSNPQWCAFRKNFFIEPCEIAENLEKSCEINILRRVFCASPVAAGRFWPIVARPPGTCPPRWGSRPRALIGRCS